MNGRKNVLNIPLPFDPVPDSLSESVSRANELLKFGEINLFEVDGAGTILYCRIDNVKLSIEDSPESVGRNLFDGTLPVENTEELRHKFRTFVKGNLPTENFQYTFCSNGRNFPARIKFLRIVERVAGQSVGSTFIDIRKLNY